MTTTTDHGDNLADQVQGADAFGDSEILTTADIWNFLDQVHSQWLGEGLDTSLLEDLLELLEEADEDLPL